MVDFGDLIEKECGKSVTQCFKAGGDAGRVFSHFYLFRNYYKNWNIIFFSSGPLSTSVRGCSKFSTQPDGCKGESSANLVESGACFCSTDLCNTASGQQLDLKKVMILIFVMLCLVKI